MKQEGHKPKELPSAERTYDVQRLQWLIEQMEYAKAPKDAPHSWWLRQLQMIVLKLDESGVTDLSFNVRWDFFRYVVGLWNSKGAKNPGLFRLGTHFFYPDKKGRWNDDRAPFRLRRIRCQWQKKDKSQGQEQPLILRP